MYAVVTNAMPKAKANEQQGPPKLVIGLGHVAHSLPRVTNYLSISKVQLTVSEFANEQQ